MNDLKILDKETKVPNITTPDKIFEDKLKESEVEYAFFTTYDGLDLLILEKMLMALPNGNIFIKSGGYDVFCGAKGKLQYEDDSSFISELLLEHVHRVVVKKSFHPKISMIFYKQKEMQGVEEEKILLVIGSKNISRSAYLDDYVCLIGSKDNDSPQKTENGNGTELFNILTQNNFLGQYGTDETGSGKEFYEKLKQLQFYHFKCMENDGAEDNGNVEAVDFIRPDEKILNFLIRGNDEDSPLIVVSPFVTDGLWRDSPVRIHTLEATAQQFEGLKNEEPQNEELKNNKLSVYKLSTDISDALNNRKEQDDEEGLRVGSLHAKMYIKHCRDMQKTYLYIGSANFTRLAFSKDNSEILVCLTYNDPDGSGYEVLAEAFKDENEWTQITSKPETTENGTGSRIPSEIYEELNKIEIKKLKSNGSLNLQYFYNDKPIEVGMEFEDDEGGTVEIQKIIPQTEIEITRNGCIEFVYKKSNEAESDGQNGNFVFDVLEKIADCDLKKKLKEELDVKIKQGIRERGRYMLQRSSFKAPIKRPHKNDEGNGRSSGRKYVITMFDTVMNWKQNLGLSEIKQRLEEYEKNFIGGIAEMDENEKYLVNFYKNIEVEEGENE